MYNTLKDHVAGDWLATTYLRCFQTTIQYLYQFSVSEAFEFLRGGGEGEGGGERGYVQGDIESCGVMLWDQTAFQPESEGIGGSGTLPSGEDNWACTEYTLWTGISVSGCVNFVVETVLTNLGWLGVRDLVSLPLYPGS